jgi:YVTN family beta-propeller protein
MTVKYAHLARRNLMRAACVCAVVALATFGSIASASAATSHYTPVPASPVTTGDGVLGVAFNPNINPATHHASMFVANFGEGTVSVIDANTQVVTKTVTLMPHDSGLLSTTPAGVA